MEQETKSIHVSLQPSPKGPMKYIAYAVLLALFLFLGVSAKNALREGGRGPLERNTISVAGEAKRFAKPDIAIASFTIHKENASLKAAQDEVSALTNRVIEYVKQEGVAEKDIKSTAFNIYPQEKDDSVPCILTAGSDYRCPPRRTVKTYVVEAAYEIKMRDLGKVGNLIAGVSDAGVNQISSLRFIVDDPVFEKLRDEARNEAISKAREEAKKLSKGLGVRLGDLVSFNEYGGPIFYDRLGYSGKGGMLEAAAPAPVITPGESEITANVTLVYEIR